MPCKFKYHLSGLVFECNIEVRELIAAERDEDYYLSVVQELPDFNSSVNDDRLCVKLGDGGVIVVKDRKHIFYLPPEQATEGYIQMYILGTINMLMSALSGAMSLHAACVVIGGRAVLFCGHSGTGKSSLAAWFALKDYTVLSDDVVALRKDDSGKIMAYPGVPRIKMTPESLELLGKSKLDFQLLSSVKEKYAFPLTYTDHTGVELSAIVFPAFQDSDPRLEPINGFEKPGALEPHVYRGKMLSRTGFFRELRPLLLLISGQVPMYHFIRPRTENSMDEGLLFLENLLINQ
ncbi:hypothetical protein PBAL39_05183 [Pedobacter sp. BAL39]|uniref:hypothetical protein n=1 Tax=Pedobacter sp. BAL39 TaxID=391596 RepID=UPI000155961A|nr:hypothetical protein [Pedobacter sp. BAL39]EDM37165.1 hypothetical protein PBAL39_05183 [Pedobacter sp. BAL39]